MKIFFFLILNLITRSNFAFAASREVYVAKYKYDKICAISYTFDDGLAEHYTIALPELEKRGFKGTSWICGYYIEQGIDAEVPRMTWMQLKEMADKGHEISNHSWSHKKMSRLPLARIKDEIEKDDSAISANIGIMPVTYCYPYNYKPDMISQVASENRVVARVKQFSIGGSKASPQRFAKWLEDLIKNKDWEVIMTHGIDYGYDAFKSPELFWEHLDEVKNMEDKIRISTFRQIASYIKKRKEIRLEVSDKKDVLVTTPKLKLNKELSAEPLTVMARKEGIKGVVVTQNKKRLSADILEDKIISDFNPYDGLIKVRLIEK